MSSYSRGIEFICGQRGTGKTKYLLTHVLEAEPRILIYDHMAELSARAIPYERTSDIEEAIDLVHKHARGICRVCYVPIEGAQPEEFAVICAVPRSVRDLVLVVDEIDQVAGSNRNPPPKEFLQLVHFGRHFGASIVACARRAADVSRALTSQSRRIVCFRNTEPDDVRYLRSTVGPEARKVLKLLDLTYLAFEGGKMYRGQVDGTA